MHKVAILSFDESAMFELGCAIELFGLARPEIEGWYQSQVVSFTEGPVNATCGIQLIVKTVTTLNAFDLLVVPSWPTNGHAVDPILAAEIRQFHAKGKRIISFCSGAFLLAELGLFDGRSATTHWRYAEKFKSRFPQVTYVDDVLYLYDGKIGCSAGSSAALDLGLELIRRDFGYRVANKVARRLVLSAHRKGGQSQFSESPVMAESSQFSQALDWALQNLQKPLDIQSLANKANMSRRSFDRRFRANLNLTAKEWLTHQRLILAKELLESQQYSIERIAELSGFETGTTMRHHFRKEMGISPSCHREQFGKIANLNKTKN